MTFGNLLKPNGRFIVFFRRILGMSALDLPNISLNGMPAIARGFNLDVFKLILNTIRCIKDQNEPLLHTSWFLA